MPILTASDLAKSYGPQDVFADLSLSIPHGAKIALVGPNGSGKTSLLRIIAGLEETTTGVVHRAKSLQIGYLPQQAGFSWNGTLWEAMLDVFSDLRAQAARLRSLEVDMVNPATRDEAIPQYGPVLERFELAGGYTYEHRIRQVLAGLGFAPEDLHRPMAQFSGGEKTRALFARLLLEDPDLLLLDEPTNHLDLEGIEWLESYLKTWKGAVLLVAHDRAFLDAVTERVWDIAWGRMEQYRGNYTAYTTQRIHRLAHQRTEYEQQRKVIAKTEDFIDRNIAGQRTRQAQGRRKRLERLQRVRRPQEYNPTNFALGKVRRSGDLVLGLYDFAAGYDAAHPLVVAQELELRRGQRVALIGPNGVGKTTLVRTILGEIKPLAGRVRIGAGVHRGYLAQGHADLDLDKTVLQTMLDGGVSTIGSARDRLARYRFYGDDVLKRVGDLSGGEQARVALAVLAAQGANLLLLDEPTNHLDIPSQEELQDVLAHFGGTLLVVSHDRYLIRALATCIWAIAEGKLWEFKYGYEEYSDWAARRRDSSRSAPEKPRAQTAQARARESRRAAERQTAKQTHRQAELEGTIHDLEDRLAQLETQLSSASEQYAVEEVRQLGAEYNQVEGELNALLAVWTDTAV